MSAAEKLRAAFAALGYELTEDSSGYRTTAPTPVVNGVARELNEKAFGIDPMTIRPRSSGSMFDIYTPYSV